MTMKKLLLLSLLSFPFLVLAQSSAFLGVHSSHVSKKKAQFLGFENRYGNYITTVIPKTAADKAGLAVFDYITGFNDIPFKKGDTMTDRLHQLEPGEKVKINFVRKGKERSRKVSIGQQGDGEKRTLSSEEDPFLGVSPVHKKLPLNVNGVIVALVDCTTASALGLMDGDIITTVDKTPMYDWHDLRVAINNREVGDNIAITYFRNGQVNKVQRPILSLAASKKCEEEAEVVEEIEMEMEDVTAAEAAEMKEAKGIDMPIVNNLEIEQLNVFPNPTNGLFELRFNLPEEGPTSIRVFNSIGVEVYRNQLGRFSGDFRDRVDIGDQIKGIYFIEIRQAQQSISKKLILQ